MKIHQDFKNIQVPEAFKENTEARLGGEVWFDVETGEYA